jgi:hypothetical protein
LILHLLFRRYEEYQRAVRSLVLVVSGRSAPLLAGIINTRVILPNTSSMKLWITKTLKTC